MKIAGVLYIGQPPKDYPLVVCTGEKGKAMDILTKVCCTDRQYKDRASNTRKRK